MYCVLMGDIVDSKEIIGKDKEKISKEISLMLERINFEYKKDIQIDFSSSRGDFFEGVLYSAYKAVEIANDIIQTLLPNEIRVSIALGELDIINDTRNANHADGDAFHIADRVLREMKNQKSNGWLHLSVNIERHDKHVQNIIDSYLLLLETMTDSWTDKQRECALYMSHYKNQQNVVANKLNITEAAVSKHLKAANYVVYKKAFENLGKYLKSIDEGKQKEDLSESNNVASWINLGRDAEMHGKYICAIDYYEKGLEIAKKEFGEKHSLLCELLNNIGINYLSLLNFDKAKDIFEHSYGLAKESNNILNEMESLNLFAELYLKSGELEKAFEYCKEALNISEKALGKGHISTAELYNNMGIIYDELEVYETALAYYIKALSVYEKVFGKNNFRTMKLNENIKVIRNKLEGGK